LDLLEESYDDANTGNNSTNMDDTGPSPFCLGLLSADQHFLSGFFSVQVLEKALNVWGLK
jgi:ataxin-3